MLKVMVLNLLLALMLTACTGTNLSPNYMSTAEAQAPAMVKRGIVLDKRSVTDEELKNQGLVSSGAIAGGVAGYSVGNDFSAVLIGTTVGYLIAQAAPSSTQTAVAYTVEIDASKILRVVQAEENEEIQIGSPVFIEYSLGMKVNLVLDRSQGQLYKRTKETQYLSK